MQQSSRFVPARGCWREIGCSDVSVLVGRAADPKKRYTAFENGAIPLIVSAHERLRSAARLRGRAGSLGVTYDTRSGSYYLRRSIGQLSG
jgi:hypothetical protein